MRIRCSALTRSRLSQISPVPLGEAAEGYPLWLVQHKDVPPDLAEDGTVLSHGAKWVDFIYADCEGKNLTRGDCRMPIVLRMEPACLDPAPVDAVPPAERFPGVRSSAPTVARPGFGAEAWQSPTGTTSGAVQRVNNSSSPCDPRTPWLRRWRTGRCRSPSRPAWRPGSKRWTMLAQWRMTSSLGQLANRSVTMIVVVLDGELAVPCTRNPL